MAVVFARLGNEFGNVENQGNGINNTVCWNGTKIPNTDKDRNKTGTNFKLSILITYGWLFER